MTLKVIIETPILRSSQHDQYLQRVATVHVEGEEYRVFAPPRATGHALEWAEQFVIRKPSNDHTETEVPVTGEVAASVILAVIAELKNYGLESDIWNWGAHPDARFYAAQICLHGHVIASSGLEKIREGEHCQICGSRCIHRCEKCNAPIRGKGVMSSEKYIAPSFCYNCSMPYPWMEDRLQTARELLWHDDKLTLEERESLWSLLQYVMSDPKSDLVPAKQKLIDIKLSSALTATREFFTDFLAKYLAEMSKS